MTVPVPNSTAMSWAQLEPEPEPELERSPCLVGIVPIVYYSVLLGLGLPGEGLRGQGGWKESPWDGGTPPAPPQSQIWPQCPAVLPSPRAGATATGTDGICIAWADTRKRLISPANPHSSGIFIAPPSWSLGTPGVLRAVGGGL